MIEDVGVDRGRMLAEGVDSPIAKALEKGDKSGMCFDPGVLAIVEPGTPHLCLVEGESQRLDEVQIAPGVDGEPHEVAGVGGDLGFVKCYMEHDVSIERGRVDSVGDYESRTPQSYRVDDSDPFAIVEGTQRDDLLSEFAFLKERPPIHTG